MGCVAKTEVAGGKVGDCIRWLRRKKEPNGIVGVAVFSLASTQWPLPISLSGDTFCPKFILLNIRWYCGYALSYGICRR